MSGNIKTNARTFFKPLSEIEKQRISRNFIEIKDFVENIGKVLSSN